MKRWVAAALFVAALALAALGRNAVAYVVAAVLLGLGIWALNANDSVPGA